MMSFAHDRGESCNWINVEQERQASDRVAAVGRELRDPTIRTEFGEAAVDFGRVLCVGLSMKET